MWGVYVMEDGYITAMILCLSHMFTYRSEQRATHSLDYEILQNKDGSSCAISDIPTADMCLADTAKMSMASTKFEYAIR